jgi:recombination protein RecT
MTDTTQTAHRQVDTNRPPIMVLRERFESRRAELKNSLPSDISPDIFIRAAMTSAQLNPDILACTWQSIWNACMRACRDGLLPDGVEGAIVPHKSTATWIPMYQGLLRRFRRSGQFKWVTANVVREGEVFSHYLDEDGEHMKHVPGYDFLAPIVKIYAMATTQDRGVFITVLPIAEANKIRAMSRATRDDAPWKQWPEEMYKKTALRRLSKYLPSARDLVDEEDDAPIAAPPPAAIEQPRAVGAAAALEQFAAHQGDRQPSAVQADLVEGGGEQGTPATEPATAKSVGAGETPAATAPSTDDVQLAYERGVQARNLKHKRTAMPGEYRVPGRERESEAWLMGWDEGPDK